MQQLTLLLLVIPSLLLLVYQCFTSGVLMYSARAIPNANPIHFETNPIHLSNSSWPGSSQHFYSVEDRARRLSSFSQGHATTDTIDSVRCFNTKCYGTSHC